MQQFVTYFWHICLMRESPERAPSATLFILLVMLAYIALSTLSMFLSRNNMTLLPAIGIVLIGLGVEAGCVWLLLLFKRFRARFRKTLVTLLGTSSILVLLVMPFNLVLLISENETLRLFSETTYWICFGWWLAIAGYIFNRSLNVSIIQGSALAFLIEVLSVWASMFLQPVP